MALPKVSINVGHAIQAEILQNNEYVADLYDRLAVENPCIANLLAAFGQNIGRDDKEYTNMATMGLLIYRLLESQAEADAMECEFEN